MSGSPPDTPAALARVSAFAGLAPELLGAMWERMEPRSYGAGDTILRQDDLGDCLLVLLEGSASVGQRAPDGSTRDIGEVRAGDVVGEMALITGEPRGADVTAREPVRAVALSAAAFERLARAHPELGIVLTNLIADRLGRRTRDALGGRTLLVGAVAAAQSLVQQLLERSEPSALVVQITVSGAPDVEVATRVAEAIATERPAPEALADAVARIAVGAGVRVDRMKLFADWKRNATRAALRVDLGLAQASATRWTAFA